MTNVNTVKIGVMPGRIETHTLEVHATFRQALAQAGLSEEGFEVKLDGVPVTNLDAVVPLTSDTILLSKRVKGNADMLNIKIGVMPGRVGSYALEVGTTFAKALEIAGLDTDGFEVKVDGTPVTNFDSVIHAGADTILLSKRVKGNNGGVVKIGVMPGRVDSFGLEAGTTYAQAFAIAGVDPEGYEVKADGQVISDYNQVVGAVDTVLLSKRVKGNAGVVKIGVMPGRVDSFGLEDGTTYHEAFEIAGIGSTDGFEVKADGRVITNFDEPITSGTDTILLAKKVKGNK